jgi:hypothetical protein
VGGEFLSDEAIARLQAIGAQGWQRHFDDRLGLSDAELRQLQQLRPEAPPLPATEALLADLPEHRIPWGEDRPAVEAGDPRNKYGFDMKLPPTGRTWASCNLAMRRGTLTEEDRFKINDHIVQTYIMLKGLPCRRGWSRCRAGRHAPRAPGRRGYPRRLAATPGRGPDDGDGRCRGADRRRPPLQAAKTLSETLPSWPSCAGAAPGPGLFRYFLRSRLWEAFAVRF